jgi:excisionase family DNA binding protein
VEVRECAKEMARAIFRSRVGPGPDVQHMTQSQLHTVPETARILSVGVRTVYALIADSKLEAVKIGRSTRVSQKAIDSFLDDLVPIRPVAKCQEVPLPRRRSILQQAVAQFPAYVPAPRRRK